MNPKVYAFQSVIWRNPDSKNDYIAFPYDAKKEFGKGLVKVHATYDGEPADCYIRNRGFRNQDGSIRYMMVIRKEVREKIGKLWGELVDVTVREVADSKTKNGSSASDQ